MAVLVRSIIRNKWYVPADPEHLSFAGRTIIVTGSNTGLGAEAARKFAAQGAARLILAVRSEDKGAKVQRLIQHLASDPKCKVEVWKLDMMDYHSIRAFAKRCHDELESLDIVLLNAGVFMPAYTQSSYGWEETLQVNTLSTTLLALLLLPKLRSSKTADFTPVLEFITSGRHYAVHFTDAQKNDDEVSILEDLNKAEKFNSGLLYRTTKLLVMYSVQTLARAVQPEGFNVPDVYVTSVCPGACQSQLARGMDSITIRVAKMAANAAFLRTAEEGSRSFVSGAALESKGHGAFWQNDVIKDPPDTLKGEDGEKLRKKVWNEVLEALGKDVPEVRDLAEDVH